MAILNINGIPKSSKKEVTITLLKGQFPVTTIDDIATAIQVDEDGDATGFTSLTNHYCSKSCSSQVIS